VSIKFASLSYSVYGIKSRNAGILIEQSVFKRNGQFNFTINEKIQPVTQDAPFTYNPLKTREPVAVASPVDTAAPVKPRQALSKHFLSPRVIRYGSLGLGVLGVGTGAIFIAKAFSYRNQRDQAGSAPDPAKEYDRLDGLSKTSSLVGDLFLGVGAAGFIGFGLTFWF
jgi:hypothetical protein